MQKNTRNALIVTAVFAAIVIPLYAFSVIGLAVLVSAALIFSALFILDFVQMRGKSTGSALPVNPNISKPDPMLGAKPQPKPEPRPVLPSKPSKTAQPTPPNLEAKFAELQKSLEAQRRLIMEQAILYAIKGRFQAEAVNQDVIQVMVNSTKYNAFLAKRPESQKNETVKFLRNLKEMLGSSPDLDEELELIAMHNFSGTLLQYEEGLQKYMTQALTLVNTYRSAHPESPLKPELLEGISTYLPFETNMVREFQEAKEGIQAGLFEYDVDSFLSLKDGEAITLQTEQKKIVNEIQGLLAPILPQSAKAASAKPLPPRR